MPTRRPNQAAKPARLDLSRSAPAPTEARDPLDDPAAHTPPLVFKSLPVKMRGKPCEHCVIVRHNGLSTENPRRAIHLLEAGRGMFRLTVCREHEASWKDAESRRFKR